MHVWLYSRWLRQGDLSELQKKQWIHKSLVATDNSWTVISYLVGVASVLKGSVAFSETKSNRNLPPYITAAFIMSCLAPFCRWLTPFVPLAVHCCFVASHPHSCTFLHQSSQLHWPQASQMLRFFSLVASVWFASGCVITCQLMWLMRSVSCLCFC